MVVYQCQYNRWYRLPWSVLKYQTRLPVVEHTILAWNFIDNTNRSLTSNYIKINQKHCQFIGEIITVNVLTGGLFIILACLSNSMSSSSEIFPTSPRETPKNTSSNGKSFILYCMVVRELADFVLISSAWATQVYILWKSRRTCFVPKWESAGFFTWLPKMRYLPLITFHRRLY